MAPHMPLCDERKVMAVQPSTSVEWSQSYKETPSRTGFLDLPRELRDYICEFAFLVQGAILIYSPNPYAVHPIAKAKVVRHKGEGPVEPQPVANIVPMPLMRSCKQLHSECSLILYGANIFRIWYLSDTELKFAYRQLIRHVIFTAQVDHRVFKADLDDVNYGWTRRFWPAILQKGTNMLESFPGLESLTFPLKPPRHGEMWKPAFFAVENKTREQRVAIAANWMKARCPWENQRLHDCLHVEVAPPAKLSKAELEGSKFDPEDRLEEEWDCSEFADAFELMKRSS